MMFARRDVQFAEYFRPLQPKGIPGFLAPTLASSL